jgi:hypothetical protein
LALEPQIRLPTGTKSIQLRDTERAKIESI